MEVAALRRIVAGASSLWERLDGAFLPLVHPSSTADHRLDRWAQTVTCGDMDALGARLRKDGRILDDARPALGSVELPAGRFLPAWSRSLEELVAFAGYIENPDSHIPFAEILTPIAAVAQRRVFEVANSALRFWTTEASNRLIDDLLGQLSSLFVPAVASELNLARVLRRLHGETPEAQYQHFLRTRLGSPAALEAFLSDYPVLARLMTLCCDQWAGAMSELILRLALDHDEIRQGLAGGSTPGLVTRCSEPLSDRHHGGRSVRAITFESGLTVMYKPMDLGIDVAFEETVRRFNNAGRLPLRLRAPRVLNRVTHGWTEFIAEESPGATEPVSDYYSRAGLLLGLLYVLGTTDAHLGNVIATADGPVLVDMETLLHLPFRDEAKRGRGAPSVLRTGLLPKRLFVSSSGAGIDPSGLTGAADQRGPVAKTVWRGFGTDRIEAALEYPPLRDGRGRTVGAERVVQAAANVEQIVNGFATAGRYFLAFRDEERNALLADFGEVTVRFLNRSTIEYSMVLERSLDVESLRDGAVRSIRLDLLSKRALGEMSEESWPLVAAERASLESLDIPRFTLASNRTGLELEDRCLIALLERSAVMSLADRVNSLSAEDLDVQSALIRHALTAAGRED